jgi:hypothetical protein
MSKPANRSQAPMTKLSRRAQERPKMDLLVLYRREYYLWVGACGPARRLRGERRAG